MSKRKKTILFIIWSFSYGGGAERILSYLIHALDATGRYDIDLLEVCHFDINWEPLPEGVTVLDPIIDETEESFFGKARRFMRRRLMRVAPFALRQAIRKRKEYDMVIAFNYQLPTFFIRPSERSISWNHSTFEYIEDNPKAIERQRKAYEHINRIVAITGRTCDSIIRLFPETEKKCEVVYNGFPVADILEKAAKPIDISLEPYSLIAVGRLHSSKRPELIFEAFRCIAEIDPRPHLYYLGVGEREESVRQLVMHYGLNDRVHFLGYQTNPYPLIKQAACVISLSDCEGFQSVLVEGLLLGVPFISSPAGAAEELSQNGTFGCVIDEPQEAVEAFEKLSCLGNEEKAAMATYASAFTPERQVMELERIMEDVARECRE